MTAARANSSRALSSEKYGMRLRRRRRVIGPEVERSVFVFIPTAAIQALVMRIKGSKPSLKPLYLTCCFAAFLSYFRRGIFFSPSPRIGEGRVRYGIMDA